MAFAKFPESGEETNERGSFYGKVNKPVSNLSSASPIRVRKYCGSAFRKSLGPVPGLTAEELHPSQDNQSSALKKVLGPSLTHSGGRGFLIPGFRMRSL